MLYRPNQLQARFHLAVRHMKCATGHLPLYTNCEQGLTDLLMLAADKGLTTVQDMHQRLKKSHLWHPRTAS